MQDQDGQNINIYGIYCLLETTWEGKYHMDNIKYGKGKETLTKN